MSMTASTEKELRAAFLQLLSIAICGCLAVEGLLLLDNWQQVTLDNDPHLSSAASDSLGMLFLLGSLFFGIPLGLLFVLFRSTRRIGVVLLIPSLLFVSTIRLAAHGGTRIRMAAFRDLAERSEPLVEAIKAYETSEGRPPNSLEELVPAYLDAIPGTGLEAYPDYELITGEDATMWLGNPWIINVHTSRGPLNWDRFMYFPMQNYGNYSGNDRVERVGARGYLHE